MLDYHLHLWEHSHRDVSYSLEQIADYCEKAASVGVTELAMTEHFTRFTVAQDKLGGFWNHDEDDPGLRASMADYFDFHARNDLDTYVELVLAAKKEGLPVVLGLEVDYYQDRMDIVSEILKDYPFDVLLGSIHWVGAWRFDDIGDDISMLEWDHRKVDDCWEAYTSAFEELAATGTCDVLAHPDLIKVTGQRPDAPAEWWDRMAEAARRSDMAAELSSAGWRKPVGVQYPDVPLLERFVANGVSFTTASDAHRLADVADRTDDLRGLVNQFGVTTLRGYRDRQGYDVAVSEAQDR
jgi:histidinol-phosphatase (PHP family)